MIGIEPLLERFQYYPKLIQIVWLVVFVLLFLISLFVFGLKILRARLRKRDRFKASYQSEIESYLIEYIYNVEEGKSRKKAKYFFEKEIRNKLKRRVILSVMVKLRVEIVGETAKSIEELFLSTKLFEYAKQKLKSSRWHIVAMGIKHLTVFKIESVSNEVLKHINHSRVEVRREVQLYFLKLFEFEGLDFLNKISSPLSEWDQVQLLAVLDKFESQEITDVESWLNSSNDTVVLFAIKLCRLYNLFDTKNTALRLLSHRNVKVRVAVIRLLTYFQVSKAKNILKEKYAKLNLDERIAFFLMLEKLSQKEDVSFVLRYIEDVNFQIKISALKILKVLDKEKFKMIRDSCEDKEYSRIVEFVAYN